MGHPCLLTLVLAIAAMAAAQASPPSVRDCEKNISFAVAEGGQPVPAAPKFAEKWIADKKRQREYPRLCFSQLPDGRARNYLVVLSTTASVFDGLTPAAHTYTRTTPDPSGTPVINGHGGTWDYSYSRVPAAQTTPTASLRTMDKARKFFVRVYNQQGSELAQYTVGTFISREGALENAAAVIANDRQPAPPQKPLAAPLSVYYVNCDVDSESTSAPRSSPASSEASTEPAAKPDAAQDAVLVFGSDPTGAKVLLDGSYAGRTPLSLKVVPGEHMVTMQKPNFGTWQRNVQATGGTRYIGAHLEQKVVMLDFAVP